MWKSPRLQNISFRWQICGNKSAFIYLNVEQYFMKKLNAYLIFGLVMVVTGCASTAEKNTEPTTETQSYLSQYSTRDRVEYVLNCVAKHGGLNYVNQYSCGCKIDKIAEKLSFKEYEDAVTFGFMGKTAGEAGGAFRDPEQAKKLKKRIKEAEEYAENSCFVK